HRRWSGAVPFLTMARVAVEHECVVTIVERLRVDALVGGQLVRLAKPPLGTAEREQREQPGESGPQRGHGFLLQQENRDEHQRPDCADEMPVQSPQANRKVASRAEGPRERAATQYADAAQPNCHAQRVKSRQPPKNRAVRPACLRVQPLCIEVAPEGYLKSKKERAQP